ncbi:alpha/beta fold hydrolase [Pedobacter punctiformis]|uniref:Alpha/beta hydrolase n=1 Tax=Pedobacter punctiformis TaxID=3004097 RepID=A0ABT4L3D0_9SPHI|nr:alpha/beta hydrolase [Pedobacter sp. HCMS5-2]MCZ4242423.1 alpha/beta hydrolase [Pedobacter sp. HCMS5-2]
MKKIHVLLIVATTLFNCCSPADSSKNIKRGAQTFLTSDGIKLAVKVAGNGPVCIYIHGGPGQDYLSFEKMGGSDLEKCFTMVYVDQRGSGHSQNAKDYSLDRVIKDIEELRIKLGLNKVYVLSHSFGGVLAVNYAYQYPEHLSGLILANSTAYFIGPKTLQEQIQYGYHLLKKDTIIKEDKLNLLIQQVTDVRKKLSAVKLGYKLIADDVNTIIKMDSIESSYKRTSDYGMEVFIPLIDSTKTKKYPEYYKNYAPITAEIKVPALIISGKHDYAIGPDYYKNYKFPDIKVIEIDGSHMLYYEKNKEFISALCNFIK